MRLDAIAIGSNPPFDVNVVIEVPIGGEPIKYEMDKEAGTLVVDRFLYTAMRYPGNYGFIPHTLSGDGDPCDVDHPVDAVDHGQPAVREDLVHSALGELRSGDGMTQRMGQLGSPAADHDHRLAAGQPVDDPRELAGVVRPVPWRHHGDALLRAEHPDAAEFRVLDAAAGWGSDHRRGREEHQPLEGRVAGRHRPRRRR